MIKEFVATGKDVDAATEAAKAGLNAPEAADVKIEVLEMPKKGFLGIGSKPAQVKASYDDGADKPRKKKEHKPKAERKPAQKQDKKQQGAKKQDVKKSEPKKQAAKKAEKKVEATAPKTPVNTQTEETKNDYPQEVDLEYAKSYLSEIIKGLSVDCKEIDAQYENGVISITLNCDDYGIIIGRRGETLDSIQYLLSLAMKKSANGYVRVVINVGNYREKRAETLKHLAAKNASYVLKTGRRHTFEPMNPYERRIIHTAIQEIEGVESRSIGYNQDRRVVIEPTGGVRTRSGSSYKRNSSRNAYSSKQNPNRAPKADRTDVPKFGKISVPSSDEE